MPSPFPGMDPYLESPTQWSDFHTRLVNVLSEVIADQLPRNYFARLGEDIVLVQPDLHLRQGREPDVLVMRNPLAATAGATSTAVGDRRAPTTLANVEFVDPRTEVFVEILRLPDQEVVTVLELLSPTNKSGEGRGFYLEKRRQLLRQHIHVVELDLIRAGRRLELDSSLPAGDYYGFISRADRHPYCDVYPWAVRNALPVLPIPLRAPDADVEIDLQGALHAAYQRGRYDRLVRYDQAPPPPSFAGDDEQWVIQTARAAVS